MNTINRLIQWFTKTSQIIDKTPATGQLSTIATNSKVARELLRMIIYVCIACMIYVLVMMFQMMAADKMDTAGAAAIGAAFTLLGGVLTVTIPAFIVALDNTDRPPESKS